MSTRLGQSGACVARQFLDIRQADIRAEEIAEVVDSLEKGWIGTGPRVRRFERMLEEYTHAPVPSAACPRAPRHSFSRFRCLGVGPGDEVIVPAMTFVASANAVEQVGATPVLVDSVAHTGLVDLEQVGGRNHGPDPRRSCPFTSPAVQWTCSRLNEHPPIGTERCDRRGRRARDRCEVARAADRLLWQPGRVQLLRDEEHHDDRGRRAGPDDPDVAAEVERLALHGLSLGAWQRFSDEGFRHYEVVRPGFKYNMTDVQASVGLHQLPRLDPWDRAPRTAVVAVRRDAGRPTSRDASAGRAAHQARAPPLPGAGRVLLSAVARQAAGWVDRAQHRGGRPLPRRAPAPVLPRQVPPVAGQLPVASSISERTLSLPLGPNVTEADQDDVVQALVELLR